MFENLQEKIGSAFKTLKGQGSITEINIASMMKRHTPRLSRCRRKL
jgi:signal recognition particle subunit SRP54